tara:strand:+ start:4725 stop:5012 length:288 start_codon:yes stop_codon:yes gene_type:complete
MVAINGNPAEELVDNIKESVSKKNIIIGGVACVFIAAAILAAVVGITYVVTGFLAYLWNVGVAPFGISEVTWWQVTAIWVLTAFIAKIIKIIFKS